MRNEEIGRLFEEIADILELQGENRFRINAYRRGAQSITHASQDIATLAREGSLSSIPGIGKDLSSKILEYLESGTIRYLEELREETPDVLLEMLRIPGVGPKTALLIHDGLGIENLEDLARAAREHRLSGLPKIRAKTEENILKGIEFLERSSSRIPLGTAYPIASAIVSSLSDLDAVDRVSFAGSLRRMRETVGDIDILVSSADPDFVINHFTHLDMVERIIAEGTTKGSVITKGDIQVDLRVVPRESYGAALNYFTGSKEHNIRLREIAQQRGMKLNEYGLFIKKPKGSEKRLAGSTEEEVYEALGLSFVPPEIREDTGEIEASKTGKLPPLVSMDEIRGDLHVHSEWSDGVSTLEDLVSVGKARGYRYLLVSDHSKSLRIANGLSEDRLREQIGEIDRINAKTRGFRLLKGSEVDILPDGSLDMSDELLSRLDIVVVAVHSRFKLKRDKMTDRVIAALENPYSSILAHPTGRLIGERDAYEIDLEAVLKAAAATGTAIEINAHPSRLDLDASAARRAAELGVLVAIGTDSHDPSRDFDHMRYGIGTARRGWLTPENIINTRTARSLLSLLHRKRNSR